MSSIGNVCTGSPKICFYNEENYKEDSISSSEEDYEDYYESDYDTDYETCYSNECVGDDKNGYTVYRRNLFGAIPVKRIFEKPPHNYKKSNIMTILDLPPEILYLIFAFTSDMPALLNSFMRLSQAAFHQVREFLIKDREAQIQWIEKGEAQYEYFDEQEEEYNRDPSQMEYETLVLMRMALKNVQHVSFAVDFSKDNKSSPIENKFHLVKFQAISTIKNNIKTLRVTINSSQEIWTRMPVMIQQALVEMQQGSNMLQQGSNMLQQALVRRREIPAMLALAITRMGEASAMMQRARAMMQRAQAMPQQAQFMAQQAQFMAQQAQVMPQQAQAMMQQAQAMMQQAQVMPQQAQAIAQQALAMMQQALRIPQPVLTMMQQAQAMPQPALIIIEQEQAELQRAQTMIEQVSRIEQQMLVAMMQQVSARMQEAPARMEQVLKDIVKTAIPRMERALEKAVQASDRAVQVLSIMEEEAPVIAQEPQEAMMQQVSDKRQKALDRVRETLDTMREILMIQGAPELREEAAELGEDATGLVSDGLGILSDALDVVKEALERVESGLENRINAQTVVRRLVRTINNNQHSLRELDLFIQNPIFLDSDFLEILTAIKKCPQIEVKLTFIQGMFSLNDLILISTFLKDINIVEFDFSDFKKYDGDYNLKYNLFFNNLANFKEGFKGVKKLSFKIPSMQQSYINGLSNIINENTLILNLRGCEINNQELEGSQILGGMDRIGFNHLVSIITEHALNIKEIDISENRLGDDAINDILSLMSIKTLNKIHLAFNNFSIDSIRKIILSLEKNDHIEAIDISNISIYDETLNILKSLESLERLNFKKVAGQDKYISYQSANGSALYSAHHVLYKKGNGRPLQIVMARSPFMQQQQSMLLVA